MYESSHDEAPVGAGAVFGLRGVGTARSAGPCPVFIRRWAARGSRGLSALRVRWSPPYRLLAGQNRSGLTLECRPGSDGSGDAHCSDDQILCSCYRRERLAKCVPDLGVFVPVGCAI